ncbi:hypothetical protein JG688_00015626 [Phytophthora aleatoria]|uniref:MRH domain-containing protein n=1 Tax=Phytophthora aleatoria TaxID=2496075 RepID=A0A8J5ISW8_9STRA|nr:hypothetical protein JG688_00015626 [Phytophthora aleatoria]
MTKELHPLSMRRTMVKSTVGHVQRTTYDLPDAKNPNHVYGYELPRDPENAGQVIGKWVHATPSPATTTGRSFIETNRQAIIHGCVSAGENRKYANEHPGIVVKPAAKCKGGFVPTNDTTYGIKSKESEDIWGLVQARYTSFSNDDAYYPDLGSMKTRGSDANNMMRLLSPLLLLGLLPAASCASSSVQIRGVAPSDQATYLSSEFSCVVGGRATNLPISRVNDEFCDCDDGQDEPGTAACSYLINAQFHCENDGFFPGKIHTSRIHDGICDCCDGSDEAIDGKSPCPNTCTAAADKFRKEAEQRLEVVKTGFEKRQATINGEIAEYFNGAQKAEATTLKELAGLKLLKDRVTVHKDREELKEKKYRMDIARQKQAEGHEGEETSKQQFSDAAEQEAVEALDFEGLDAVRVADDDVPVNSAEDERASEVLDSRRGTVKSLVELPDGTRIPLADYLRMNHNKQAPTKKLAPRTAEEMRREDFLGPLFNGGAEGRKRIGLYALRTIEQNEKREAAKVDYGPDRAYFALKDKCIEKRIEKYEYKFCAFGEVKQDHTKLGKWDGWAVGDTNDSSSGEGNDKVVHTKMRYSKGQRCYKGPERSVLVHLECGKHDEILSVDEPSTCVYQMIVRSPLACTSQVLAKAERDVAFWTRAHYM